ncbi:MAG: sugar transferase [Candidatus Hodarchaeota archaeon]
MNNLSPIVYFCYNRAKKTEITLKSLSENILAEKSELFIFSDGPKNRRDIKRVNAVRKVIKLISGFKKICICVRKTNFGIKKNIISGISEVIKKFGKVIVVEDDINTSKHFLEFLNECLDFYKTDKNIFGISGYNRPHLKVPDSYPNDIYLFPYRFPAWGWATWLDRWNKIDFKVKDYYKFINDKEAIREFKKGGIDAPGLLKAYKEGKAEGWAIQAAFSEFKNRAYTLYPIKSLVNNIGFDNSGTHGAKLKGFQNIIDDEDFKKPKLIESAKIFKTNYLMVKRHQEAIKLKLKYLETCGRYYRSKSIKKSFMHLVYGRFPWLINHITKIRNKITGKFSSNLS